jgi:large conductance mechanosensitive channel
MQGFKDFIMRGNVIDMAVGIVIGAAFTAIITAFVDGIIAPIIALFGGGNVDGFAFRLNPSNEATLVDLGLVLSAIIAFLITASVVYFVFVMPMNKLADRRARGQEPEPDELTKDQTLLADIRALLAAQNPEAAARIEAQKQRSEEV